MENMEAKYQHRIEKRKKTNAEKKNPVLWLKKMETKRKIERVIRDFQIYRMGQEIIPVCRLVEGCEKGISPAWAEGYVSHYQDSEGVLRRK
jgi:hypothetical protein